MFSDRRAAVKSWVIALIAVIIVAGAFSGLYLLTQTGAPASKKAEAGYITITDMAGRTVEIPSPVKTIATTIPDALRLVVILGAADRVVGVTSYVDKYGSKMPCIIAYPELLNAARTGMAREIDVEKIAEVKPDVVLLYTPYADLADTIEKNAGVPVVCVNIPSDSPEGFYKALRLVGKVLGEEERAEEVISYFKAELAKIESVTSPIPEDEKPKVYLANWAYRHGVGWTTKSYWPLELAGGINVAKDIPAHYMEVTKEEIVNWNPDVILVHGYKGKAAVDEIIEDPALQTVNAVKEGRVYGCLGPYIGNDPVSLLVDTYHIAKLLYPEKFADIDVLAKGEEVYQKLYGKPGLFKAMLEARGLYLTDELTPQ